jgi:DNA-binding IclR family transcriptional regulator
MLKTVRNAGQVLDLFDGENPERGATEVAALLCMPKSQAHALLSTLSEIGLLRKTPQRRYRVGWRVLAMGRVLSESTEFRRPARRLMAQLATQFGETVHLAALEGDRVVYIERFEGTHAVRIAVSSVGSMLPAHCSGVGKMLLAHMPPDRMEAIVADAELQAFTPATITDPELLATELAEVRRRGVAYDREEVLPEVCCVAAPIAQPPGETVAALSITAPAHRFAARQDHFELAVTRGADMITRYLRDGFNRAAAAGA